MSIIFDENGLKDINPPCVAQTFINHNARLFKLFIIRDRYFVIERPSIKNFKPSGKCATADRSNSITTAVMSLSIANICFPRNRQVRNGAL